MSYHAQSLLTVDVAFQSRVDAVNTQQAVTFANDQRPAYVALSSAILRGDGAPAATLLRLDAAGPGIADKVDNGDGTIDQTKVTDPDLLSMTQTNWPVVAGLYFNEDGTPKT